MTVTAPPMELWMVIKDRFLLKQIMETKDISARQMSAMMNWKSHSYMNRILKGEVRSISDDAGVRMAYVLQVPVDLLFLTKASGDFGRNVRKVPA